MKQKDIALIGVIVFISAIISYFVSNLIFAPPKNRQQQVEVVQPISSSFAPLDNRYFNTSSFDPTKTITIQQNSNTNPFNSTTSNP